MTPSVCDDCRRPLTSAASIRRGYGPTCWRNRGGAAGRTAGREDAPRPTPGPGQTAIRIDPYQPALPLLPRGPYPADRVWRGRRLIDTDTRGLT